MTLTILTFLISSLCLMFVSLPIDDYDFFTFNDTNPSHPRPGP